MESSCLGGKSWEVPQRAWLAFCIASLSGPSPGAPQPRSEEWRCRRGRGRDGREVAAGQTGDVESQGRQLHKDRHGAEGKGGEDGGGTGGLEAATVKSGSVRELGSSSMANLRMHDEVMKTWTVSVLTNPQPPLRLPVTAEERRRAKKTPTVSTITGWSGTERWKMKVRSKVLLMQLDPLFKPVQEKNLWRIASGTACSIIWLFESMTADADSKASIRKQSFPNKEAAQTLF